MWKRGEVEEKEWGQEEKVLCQRKEECAGANPGMKKTEERGIGRQARTWRRGATRYESKRIPSDSTGAPTETRQALKPGHGKPGEGGFEGRGPSKRTNLAFIPRANERSPPLGMK